MPDWPAIRCTHLRLAVLVLAAATSRMKVKLPGINGNMSVNLPFLLMAVVNLSALEAVLSHAWRPWCSAYRSRAANSSREQMVFNVSMMAFATSMAHLTGMPAAGTGGRASEPLMLALTTAVFFLGRRRQWPASLRWPRVRLCGTGSPGSAFRAVVVSVLCTECGNHLDDEHGEPCFGWQTTRWPFPFMFAIHRSYRPYFAETRQASRSTGWRRRRRQEHNRQSSHAELPVAISETAHRILIGRPGQTGTPICFSGVHRACQPGLDGSALSPNAIIVQTRDIP